MSRWHRHCGGVLPSGSVDAFRIEVHMVDDGCCCHFDRSPLAQFFSASLQKYCDAALAPGARLRAHPRAFSRLSEFAIVSTD
jgi:hypothetical protein